MALILDAGALIAYEQASPVMISLLTEAQKNATPVRTTTGVVAQVWRDGARQARLARLLAGVEERPFDSDAARRTGRLLALDGTADVVDASLVDIAQPGDEIVTTDPTDLARLAASAGKSLSVLPLISPEELESLEDTLELLSDPEAMRQLEESKRAYEQGDFITAEELRRQYPAK